MTMRINFYHDDLPDHVEFDNSVALDTETTGLSLYRDRLCLVQLAEENGTCHIIQFNNNHNLSHANNLKKILQNSNVLKIFHYARFDVAMLYKHLHVMAEPIFCTKIASKLARTYSDRHGLQSICRELLGVEISKTQQSSDWAGILSDAQKKYASDDVIHLHKLKDILHHMLERENRTHIAQSCFQFIATRVHLDLLDFQGVDIFNH